MQNEIIRSACRDQRDTERQGLTIEKPGANGHHLRITVCPGFLLLNQPIINPIYVDLILAYSHSMVAGGLPETS